MSESRPNALSEPGTFTAFGLTISSCIRCPELRPATGVPDISVSYGDLPPGLPPSESPSIRYQTTAGQFLLHVDGVGRFRVRNGNEIVIDRHPDAADDDVRLFLLGSAFGTLLHQRGILVLHGSTVKVNGECAVFLGKSGAGKSTLAAALVKRGFSYLGDDLCAVSIGEDGVPYAAPAYPQAKLRVDALQHFGIDETQLRRIRPSREKRAVPLEGRWDEGPVPVRHLYVLSPGWLKLDPVLQPIKGSARLRVLRDYTYRMEFLHGLDLSLQHFKQVAQLASRLGVTRVVRPREGFVVERLADIVAADLGAKSAPVHMEQING